MDLISLLFGVLLAGVGALLFFGDVSPRFFSVDYAGPVVLGLLGVVMLAVGAMRTTRRRAPEHVEPELAEPGELLDQD